MKKFRIVGLLLVLCLISSSFVGVTFAKYTSTASGSDKAVVAKWEIHAVDKEISVTGSPVSDLTFDLFGTIGDDVIANPVVNDGNVADAANELAATKQIIAPGTGGSFTFTIKNMSEVNATYTIKLTETQSNLPTNGLGEEIKIPLRYSLDNNTWETAISNLNITNENIAMNTDAGNITVYWQWVIGADSANVTDTALGIAAQAANRPEVTIGVEITVSQVD